MNYMTQLNAFYELLQGNPMTSSEQLLYHTLLMVNNACGWLKWFQRTNQSLCGLIGIDEKTLIGARNKLKQRELIDFIPAKKKGEVTKYRIVELFKDTNKKMDNNMDGNNPPIPPSYTPPIPPPETPSNTPDIYKQKKTKEKLIIPFQEIIEYLNLQAGTNYRASSKNTIECITARWDDGYRLEQFKIVVDKKCQQWIGTDQELYLRPKTLFGPKFEDYLNQKVTKNQVNTNDNVANASAYKSDKEVSNEKCPYCLGTGIVRDAKGEPIIDGQGQLVRCDKCKKGGK